MTDDLDRIKEDMVACARRAYNCGLQTGNGGNLSCRAKGRDLVIIKASGYSFGECGEDNLITVDMDGTKVDGDGSPSRELKTHLAIYRSRPDIFGIFHCHSPWAIAYAEFDSEIPCLALHAAAKIGTIPVLNISGHADQNVVDAVTQLLAQEKTTKAFVQSRHGIFGLGPSIVSAEHTAELVEETAQIAWLISMRQQLQANVK